MDEDQLDRHMASRRGALNKTSVRKLVNHVLSQSVSQHVAMVVSGVAKIFVGEIIEKGTQLMTTLTYSTDSRASRLLTQRTIPCRRHVQREKSNRLEESKAHSDRTISAKPTGSTISNANDRVTIHRVPTLGLLAWARGDACFEPGVKETSSAVLLVSILRVLFTVCKCGRGGRRGLELRGDFAFFLEGFCRQLFGHLAHFATEDFA